MAALAAVTAAQWIGIALTAGAGAYAGITARNAGIAQSQQIKMQAAREGDSARQREIERKRALLRALSQQSANAAAAGVVMDGSLEGIARADIRDATNDLLVDQSNNASRQRGLRAAAGNARAVGNARLVGSLFDTARSVNGQL